MANLYKNGGIGMEYNVFDYGAVENRRFWERKTVQKVIAAWCKRRDGEIP